MGMRFGSKRLGWVAVVVALLVGVLLAGPRNALGPDTPSARQAPPAVATDLDAWLAQQESAHTDIRPGLAKGVVWHGAVGQRTPWAVVYIHGYTASRLETAPLAERVAQGLGANLFHTRLTGHGRSGAAMGEASAQDWMADTLEAVRIGQLLGERVLVVGVSTGATLATWLGTRPEGQGVAASVFVSPNYGPKDKRSELINGPWGQPLALALEGDNRGKAASGDPREDLAWTQRYPTKALFPMMALVKHVRDSDLSAFRTPLLVLYAPGDQTVDPQVTERLFPRLGSPNKVLEAVTYSEAKGQHVLAGDIRAPRATGPMADRILAWVRSLPPR